MTKIKVHAFTRRLIASMASGMGARILTLPLSGGASILSVRTITGAFGSESYATYALLASLPLLFPVADLGLGAGLTTLAARLPGSAAEFQTAYTVVAKRLFLVALVIVALSIPLGLSGSWNVLFQIEGTHVNVAATLTFALFGLSIPLSLGARVLVGFGRNSWATLVQSSFSMVTLLVVWVSAAANWQVLALTAPALGLVTSAGIQFLSARRQIVRLFRRDTPKFAPAAWSEVRSSVMVSARAMLLISTVGPLIFQLDRLILSWQSSIEAVADYSAVAILYLPMWSVLQVGYRGLWAVFANTGVDGSAVRKSVLVSLFLAFTLGLSGALFLLLAGPYIVQFATNATINPAPAVLLGFGMLLIAQSCVGPASMILTDSGGLRFQARLMCGMAATVLPVSIFLASLLGAFGPLLATTGGIVLWQIFPYYRRIANT